MNGSGETGNSIVCECAGMLNQVAGVAGFECGWTPERADIYECGEAANRVAICVRGASAGVITRGAVWRARGRNRNRNGDWIATFIRIQSGSFQKSRAE